MIKFDLLETNLPSYRDSWKNAFPFAHLVLDELISQEDALRLQGEFPNPEREGLRQSRDYVFAKNKYEKSGFWEFGPACKEFYDDLMSPRFATLIQTISGHDVWVDPQFHGGGMHQGAQGSFLDMHTDFNVHPLHPDWFRDLNILVYLNPRWQPSWGGALKLKSKRTGMETEVEPAFGRCVIMKTRDYTLHGYDPIRFPVGEFRRSIACYAYSPLKDGSSERSTTWYPQNSNPVKQILGRIWPHLVRVKSKFFGSATAKNK